MRWVQRGLSLIGEEVEEVEKTMKPGELSFLP
jgi:hypothetical protein